MAGDLVAFFGGFPVSTVGSEREPFKGFAEVLVGAQPAGEMPMKINSGVIRKPPPMPNIPEMNPTAMPIPRTRKIFTGRSAIGR